MREFIVPPLNPVALLLTIIMCIVVVIVKRKYIVIPLIPIGCFITSWQMILIFGFNFSMLRIIIFVGLFRITIRNEWADFKFNSIDKILILFILIKIISYTILWSTPDALVYILGQSVDILGAYLFVRASIHDFKDYDSIIKTIIIVSIPIMFFMLYEHYSGGYNIFSLMGGVPEMSAIREGRLRAQGAFAHAILAGTFGASLLPLAWGLRQRGYKLISHVGIVTSLVITVASSSSGPILTLLFGILGLLLWNLRDYTATIRKLFFLTLLMLHLVMNAPIWHLLARVNVLGGSTGNHRYRLIDAAVHNFSQWFLLGIQTTEVWGRGLWDITNQYLAEGALGGIITMVLFIVIMAKSFKTIGISRAGFENRLDLQKYVWSFGVLLFAYAWTFISVTFFGQMTFFYYLLIAMISSLKNLSFTTSDNNVSLLDYSKNLPENNYVGKNIVSHLNA